MGFILFILLLFLFAGLFIFLMIVGFFRSLFGIFRKNPDRDQSNSRNSSSGAKKRNKVFDNSEGEYVDYEEVKE